MPPKPKLTKAEKEKIKQEEEQRKAEEEAEARIKAEEEEKEKKQKEQEEAAQRKKQENEEKKTRVQEMVELKNMLSSNRDALQELHDERRKKSKWNRYMRCDGSPDPTNQGEINTYINLRLEDTENDDIESVFKASELDTSLIQELEFLLEDTPPEELSVADVALYKNTKEELQQLIKKKMDAATMHLLQEATDRADPETFNLQFEAKNPDVCLSIWGNLSKNPRIKSFEFQKQGLTFDIPRVLCLSDSAIRVLDPRYDHYSPTCKSYYPRQKKKPEPVEEPKPEEEVKEEELPKEEEKQEEEVEREPTEGGENKKDLMAALRELEDGPKDEDEQEEKKEEKEEEVEDYEFEDPPTPEPLEWEDFEEDEDVVDLRANDIVGGVFHFDLMHLPPQPNTMNKWVVTRLVDPPEIQYMEYVADIVTQVPKENQSSGNTPVQSDQKRDEKPPIGIVMKLPSQVLFSEEPLVARWDYKKKYWRQDGFTDLSYDEDNRIFSFKTAYFGTFALLQDSHLNMPFQSWELRPHSTNSAVLTIIAAIVEVEIEIKDSMCCISKPDDRPELDHIRNKWVTPKDLIKLMKLAGINLFPAEDSSKYVSIQNKHPTVTQWTYEQMALLSSSIAFSWSKFNAESETSEKILFQASEALEDEPLLEEDWAIFLMTKRRAMKLKVTEFDETYEENYAEGTSFRSNLYHLLMAQCSEEAKERIRNTSYQYVDCVEQILKATKILTYA